MMLLPDETQGEVYKAEIAPAAKKGAALGFAHVLTFIFIKLNRAPIWM